MRNRQPSKYETEIDLVRTADSAWAKYHQKLFGHHQSICGFRDIEHAFESEKFKHKFNVAVYYLVSDILRLLRDPKERFYREQLERIKVIPEPNQAISQAILQLLGRPESASQHLQEIIEGLTHQPILDSDPYANYQAPFLFKGGICDLNSYFGEERYKVASLEEIGYPVSNLLKGRKYLRRTLFMRGIPGLIRYEDSSSQRIVSIPNDVGGTRSIETYCNSSMSGIPVKLIEKQ
ncbi:MAG: hypothetical protein ABIG89_05680 [Candidatus Woesearchaeota archaeon]